MNKNTVLIGNLINKGWRVVARSYSDIIILGKGKNRLRYDFARQRILLRYKANVNATTLI